MLSSRKSLRRIVVIIVAVLIVTLPLLYFYAWRPADSEYAAAANTLKSMGSAKSTMDITAGNIQNATYISNDAVALLDKSLKQYNNDIATLSKNVVISRDSTTKTTYEQNINTISDYGKSANNLVISLKAFLAVLDQCSTLANKFNTLSSTTAFDEAAENCKNAIDSTKSSPSTVFNDQFFDKYADLANQLVKEDRKIMQAYDKGTQVISLDGVSSVSKKINDLLESKLTLKPTPDPTDALAKLTDVINSQKKSFVR